MHSLLRGKVAKENEGTERFGGNKSWDLLNSFMLLPHLFLKLHMHNLYMVTGLIPILWQTYGESVVLYTRFSFSIKLLVSQ